MKSFLNFLNRFAVLIIILLVIGFGMFKIFGGNNNDNKQDVNTQTANPTSIQEPTPTPQEPPRVAFSGSVVPSMARQGEKVVITFEIENLDDTQTIEGMRILFANNDFIEEGLSIVNVMSGGTQQGRAFQWTNDLMKIPPKEKRTFTIVANANEPGSYESVVTFVNPSGTPSFDDQNQELNARLLIY